MDPKYTTDDALAKAIAANDMDAWNHLVHQYHGRLMNFAFKRVKQTSDAEDVVQETFVSVLKSLKNNPDRQFNSLENYFFAVLRNVICSQYRTRWAKSVCLLQDVYRCSDEDPNMNNAFDQIASDDLTVSRYVSDHEQQDLMYNALAESLAEKLVEYKQSLNFRNLKICDLIFYSRLSSVEAARILDMPESSIRVFKFRFLKDLQVLVAGCMKSEIPSEQPCEDLLSDIWEEHRFTCPKYSTLKRFTKEDVAPEWFEYIDFHLTTLGCHFCRAGFKDLQAKQANDQETCFEKQIIASTIGFFKS